MDIWTLDLEFSDSRNWRISFLEPSSRFAKAVWGIWDMEPMSVARNFCSDFMRALQHAPHALSMEAAPQNLADEAYKRRLKADIAKLETFIAQSETAEAVLRLRVSPEEIDPKIDAIALHHAASKLAYIPEKGDVLGQATASVKTQELVEASRDAYATLKTFAKDRHEISETYRQLADDYAEITAVIDRQLASASPPLPSLSKNLAIKDQLETLDKKLTVAADYEQTLTKHLKRLVVTSLMVEGWEKDSEKFKEASALSMQMVQQLVQAAVDAQITEQPQWVTVRQNPVLQKFITQLILGDLVYVEDDGEMQRIRLREYGL